MLLYLEKRANALRSADFEKATEIELEMTEYKDAHYHELMQPNTAYCTFKYYQAFQAILNKDGFEYKGEKLLVRRANQPTNVLWENFEMTAGKRKIRYCFIILFIVVLGFLYFCFACFAIQLSMVVSYLGRNPRVNCQQMIDFYGLDGLERMASLEIVEGHQEYVESLAKKER